MRGIFISYRREDAEGQAGRLFDDLANEFGNAAVFMDVAGIEPGRDFRRAIDENVANFDPSCLHTHFTHVQCLVKKLAGEEEKFAVQWV